MKSALLPITSMACLLLVMTVAGLVLRGWAGPLVILFVPACAVVVAVAASARRARLASAHELVVSETASLGDLSGEELNQLADLLREKFPERSEPDRSGQASD